MAFDKKYNDKGKVGSHEELEAYGVWVKSEPQDLASGFGASVNFETGSSPFEVAGFDDEVMPYDADFSTGFDDIGFSGIDFSDLGSQEIDVDNFRFSGIADEADSIEDFSVNNFEERSENIDRGNREEMSTQLLMKIADELSSIRAELTTLKMEFAGARMESRRSTGEEANNSSFFSDGDDEKIALTGDEMDDILGSAGFQNDKDLSHDSLRDEDEAALKKLSELNDDAGFTLNEDIDFDSLGMDLDNEIEKSSIEQSMLSELDNAFSDDFGLSFEDTSSLLDSSPLLESPPLLEASVFDTTSPDTLESFDDIDTGRGFDEEFPVIDTLEELDELHDIRLKGADPLIPAPENTAYLEEDPFLTTETGLEDLSLKESAVNLNLDESVFGFSFDDFDIENQTSLENNLDDDFGNALMFDQSLEEMDDADISLEELPLAESNLEDISIGMDNFMESSDTDAEDSLAQVIPEAFETGDGKTASPYDDDLEAFIEEELAAAEDTGKNNDFTAKPEKSPAGTDNDFPSGMKDELKKVLSYMDHLLESLPEEKIEEFAKSEYFDTYKKLFKELGLV
jgi:hypothetical protein